jgi:hypothetical protein
VADFDLFADQLLEEAKRFLEKAGEASNLAAQVANLHAALMLSFCALEAHVNSIGEEFSIRADLSAHERGLMLEQDVRLEDGEFQLKPGLKMAKLEDRIEFLHAKLSGNPLDRSSSWWARLSTAMNLRNKLTHAKNVPEITESSVRNAVEAIIEVLEVLYQAIYKRTFPPSGQGLQSRLTF